LLILGERTTEQAQSEELFSWIITGHEYQYWNGLLIPYLIVKQGKNTSYTPFIDYKHLILSEDKYCITCQKKTIELDWNKLCPACANSISSKKYACIYTQTGHPFGKKCFPNENPVCQDEYFKAKYCSSEYVIYLGRFGSSLKVGITRYQDEEGEKIYTYRIINQGFDNAIVFKGQESLNLKDVQELEKKIGDYFQIPMRLGFQDKKFSLGSLNDTLDPKILEKIARLVEETFPEIVLLEVIQNRDNYWGFYQDQYKRIKKLAILPEKKKIDKIIGEVIMARGELALIEEEGQQYWINIRNLYGRCFYNWED